ncbi:unnamed protein product [Haemonchus placei]|uniref:Nuclear transcription factor Y subunit n=1 Tax=Haemonchus placei TaxID=6290 RepID=A0A0N4W772_HAEPC|nr:unnamed protein product [Haemonchus placei]
MSSSIVDGWKFGYGSMQEPRSRQRHRVQRQRQSQHHVSQYMHSSGRRGKIVKAATSQVIHRGQSYSTLDFSS